MPTAGISKKLVTIFARTWLIILGIVLGYVGNYVFLKHSKNKIAKTLSSTDEESIKIRKLKKAGRGNWVLVLSVVLILALGFIIGNK